MGAALRVIIADFLNFSDFGFYGWNWTYLLINAIGAFGFGFLEAVFKFRFPFMQSRWYAFFAEAAVASFTAFDLIFSQISLISLQPEVWILIFYVGVNFIACIACSSVGMWLGFGKGIFRKRHGVPRHSPVGGSGQKKRSVSARHGY